MKSKTMKTAIFAALALFATSGAFAKDYIIKKGDHYSNTTDLPSHYSGSSMKFQAIFDDSAIYNLGNENQYDINKLYGTTDCGSWSPTQNSARFGWVWNLQKKKLEIWAFVHVNGEFKYEWIDDINLNQTYNYELTLSSDHSKYEFNFNGKTVSMDRSCSDSEMSGWQLKPYFGGNEVAPHEVLIKVEEDLQSLAMIKNIYPNPSLNSNLHVVLNLPLDASIGFRIYDLNGKLVREIDPVDFSAGDSIETAPISTSGLSQGIYLLVPFDTKSGSEEAAYVHGQGRAMKFMVLQ